MKIMYKNGKVVSDYFNEQELVSVVVNLGSTLGDSESSELYAGITDISYKNNLGWPWVDICEFSNVLSDEDEYQVEVFNSTGIVKTLENGPLAEALGLTLQLLRDYYVKKGIVDKDISCRSLLKHALTVAKEYEKKGEAMKLVVTEQGNLDVVNFNERLFAENVFAIMDRVNSDIQVELMIGAFKTADILKPKKGSDIMIFEENEGNQAVGITSCVHTSLSESVDDGTLVEGLGWMLAWAAEYYSEQIDFENEEENSLIQVIRILETKQERVSDEN